VFEVGGRITTPGAVSPQLAIHIGEGTGPINYYCEIFDDGNFELKLTHYNNGYTVLAEAPISGTFSAGARVRLLFEHLPPSLRCVGWWNGVRYEVTGNDPGDVPANTINFAISDLEMENEYAVRHMVP
jgi:hypothetical protein